MKVIVNGKEIELIDSLDEGELEFDKHTPREKEIDMEDTQEITEEMLKQIREQEEIPHE